MKIVKKYSIAVIGILMFLLCCKSCQSCMRGRVIEFNQIQYEQKIDSIEIIAKEYKDSIVVLNERLKAAEALNGSMQQHITDINTTNTELTKSNNNLINHIKNQNEKFE